LLFSCRPLRCQSYKLHVEPKATSRPDSISRAEKREADFMQKRAEYIKKMGMVSITTCRMVEFMNDFGFGQTHQDFFKILVCSAKPNQTF
jgi:hypothetical protein